MLIQNCLQLLQLSASSSPLQLLFAVNLTVAATSSSVLLNLCNVVHGIQIPCMHEHVVEANTTFSYIERNLRRHVFCNAFHDGKAPSPCDNLDIGNGENDIEMHAQEDQAFFATVILELV